MPEQKKTPLPVAAEQEGNTSSLATASVPELSQSVKERKHPKRWNDIHTEKLKNLMLGDHTIQEIADTMGFSKNTIFSHLREIKAKQGNDLTPEEENKLRSLVISGWSVQQIARKLGYAESTIQKYIPAAKAQLKEKYGAPPLGDIKQGQDRASDEKKPAPAPLEKIVIPVAADSGLLAPGEPLLDVLENQIDIITDNYCGTIDSLCADSAGLEIRWHDDNQKGQLIIRVEPIKEE